MTDKLIVNFTKMVTNLEYVGKIAKLEIHHANFKTGTIVVVMTDNTYNMSFKDMMARIKFIDMSERLVIEQADFETGEITIKVLDYNKTEELTKVEMDFLRNGKTIQCIKAVRQRRINMSLSDAKNFVLRWKSKLYVSGELKSF